MHINIKLPSFLHTHKSNAKGAVCLYYHEPSQKYFYCTIREFVITQQVVDMSQQNRVL